MPHIYLQYVRLIQSTELCDDDGSTLMDHRVAICTNFVVYKCNNTLIGATAPVLVYGL